MQEHKSFTNLYIFVVLSLIYTYKGMGITRKQIQLVQLLCSCIKDNKIMEDAEVDEIPHFIQISKNVYNKLMPRPSARTKYLLSWTKLELSKKKILSRVKKYIFCFQKSFKTKFADWKSIFNNKYSFYMTF